MSWHAPRLFHQGLRAVRRNAIDKLLRGVFGVARLRPGQRLVVDSVLDGNETLAIMATGSGKSQTLGLRRDGVRCAPWGLSVRSGKKLHLVR